MRLLGAYIYSKENNTFVWHGHQYRRPKQQKELPTMHVKGFATKRPNEESLAWDTYGLPFLVDNSATAIICNVRKVFACKLIPTKIMLKTSEGTSATTSTFQSNAFGRSFTTAVLSYPVISPMLQHRVF